MNLDSLKLTGLILVEKAIEFKAMTPDPSQWSFEKQKNNEPRLVRLQQLKSLLKLFLPEIYKSTDLRGNIESIFNGNFILQRDVEIYDKLFIEMGKLIGSSKYKNFESREWEREHLRYNYQDLLRYKTTIRKLIEFNSGIMENSYPYLYSLIVSNNTSEKIDTKNLDEFLWTAIDPNKRTYHKEQLIKNYNYPDRDLFDIDIDWM